MESQIDQLVESARRGDTAAANRLIELFYERIYAFLRRLAANDADAADLTQRTFTRVWQALPTFAGRSSFSSWIHGIAHHVYVAWRRANHRIEPRSEAWWAEQVSSERLPDETSARSDLAAKLYECVDALEIDLRDTIHLHYYQELTLQETADALGIATSTVKYRLRHALAELQKNASEDFGSTQRPYETKRTRDRTPAETRAKAVPTGRTERRIAGWRFFDWRTRFIEGCVTLV